MNTVHCEASVLEASRRMRQCHASELIVVTETDGIPRPLGVVTARDIVTRVMALGLDPEVLTAGDIAAFKPVPPADD
jgi:CBS domain-containing protein